jgi:hypothetical protein
LAASSWYVLEVGILGGGGVWYVFDEITKRKKEVKMDGKATSSWSQR